MSRKRNPGSIRYILVGVIGLAPFNFLKRPATKYDVKIYAGWIYFMIKDVENDTPNDTQKIPQTYPIHDTCNS